MTIDINHGPAHKRTASTSDSNHRQCQRKRYVRTTYQPWTPTMLEKKNTFNTTQEQPRTSIITPTQSSTGLNLNHQHQICHEYASTITRQMPQRPPTMGGINGHGYFVRAHQERQPKERIGHNPNKLLHSTANKSSIMTTHTTQAPTHPSLSTIVP